jgi:hypothetical protein
MAAMLGCFMADMVTIGGPYYARQSPHLLELQREHDGVNTEHK